MRVRSATRGIVVTDGHEAKAMEARSRKRPNRIGMLFLRMLGFRGQVAPPTAEGGHVGPSHEHAVHDEHQTPDKYQTPDK